MLARVPVSAWTESPGIRAAVHRCLDRFAQPRPLGRLRAKIVKGSTMNLKRRCPSQLSSV